MADNFLSRSEAAEYLNSRGLTISAGTLSKMATTGGGPSYAKWGNRCVYTPAELDAWIAWRLRNRRFASESVE